MRNSGNRFAVQALRRTLGATLAGILGLGASHIALAQAPRVIELTQVPCQFLESEGVNHGYTSRSIKDYEIELKPGEYLYSCPLNTTPDYKLVVKQS